MTDPNSGSSPYGQAPQEPGQGYSGPPSGSTPAQSSQFGSAPSTGSQQAWGQDATQSYGQQYGGQQYGDQQYAGQQYGGQAAYGQQYGAQQGYDQAGGYPQPGRPPKRPGIATSAAVVGIVVSAILGFFFAIWLIAIAEGTSQFGASADAAFILAWIAVPLGTIGAIVLFIGSIQLLSGASVSLLRIGSAMLVFALVLLLIAFATVGVAGAGLYVFVILLAIAPVIVFFLAASSDVSRWMARKKAYKMAGYDDI